MTLQEVLSEVARLSPTGGLVEITGGEPMLQEREAIPLMEQLLDATTRCCLKPAANVPEACSQEGHQDRRREVSAFRRTGHVRARNLERFRPHDEIKFVLTDRTDYEFACDFVVRHSLAERVHAILFSPAFEKTASALATLRTACSIPRNSPSGSSPTTSRAPQPANHKLIGIPPPKGLESWGRATRPSAGQSPATRANASPSSPAPDSPRANAPPPA